MNRKKRMRHRSTVSGATLLVTSGALLAAGSLELRRDRNASAEPLVIMNANIQLPYTGVQEAAMKLATDVRSGVPDILGISVEGKRSKRGDWIQLPNNGAALNLRMLYRGPQSPEVTARLWQQVRDVTGMAVGALSPGQDAMVVLTSLGTPPPYLTFRQNGGERRFSEKYRATATVALRTGTLEDLARVVSDVEGVEYAFATTRGGTTSTLEWLMTSDCEVESDLGAAQLIRQHAAEVGIDVSFLGPECWKILVAAPDVELSTHPDPGNRAANLWIGGLRASDLLIRTEDDLYRLQDRLEQIVESHAESGRALVEVRRLHALLAVVVFCETECHRSLIGRVHEVVRGEFEIGVTAGLALTVHAPKTYAFAITDWLRSLESAQASQLVAGLQDHWQGAQGAGRIPDLARRINAIDGVADVGVFDELRTLVMRCPAACSSDALERSVSTIKNYWQ